MPKTFALLLTLTLLSAPLRGDDNPMTDSLPRADGTLALAGLSDSVEISRDSQAIPVIAGSILKDVIRAQGYLHAQERFVQMDLMRRAAAGELAELGGPLAVQADRATRPYRFRDVARRVVEQLDGTHRDLLRAYTEGVNAGLSDLGAVPPEYNILQLAPEPWREEDSILVTQAMFLTLQGRWRDEPRIAVMRETLPRELASFLLPETSRFDVPLLPDGAPDNGYRPHPIPGPDVIDLRRRVSQLDPTMSDNHVIVEGLVDIIGSNNWAVSGARSVHGGAIVANDMHLALTSPGIWYRSQFEWGGRSAGGLTLPGAPGLVSGATDDVAWGFTNTYGDFGDYVVIEVDPDDSSRYRTPDGWEKFETITELIAVRGRRPEPLELRSTRWGIVMDADWRGRPLVLKWVALEPEAVDVSLVDMMNATSLDEAIELARTFGMPSQNIVIGDRHGRIGWVVSGYLPQREGYDGTTPQSWASGKVGWTGQLLEEFRPVVVDPKSGVLFTANNRTIQGERSRLISHGFSAGHRAHRISELLDAKEKFSERDLLAIQLDTRANLYAPYRALIAEITQGEPDDRLRSVAQLVKEWNGTADIDQPAFRLLTEFRATIHARLINPLTAACRDADPGFSYRWANSEEVVLRLLEERPAHLLPTRYSSWKKVLASSLRDVLDSMANRQPNPGFDVPWGDVNRAAIGHPLGEIAPQLAKGLRMPADPLPGHWSTVRMASPRFGASARMVVSPGRAAAGILHMPSGQSGHYLSPHFRDGHEAWVKGLPTPFLPGEAISSMTLVPED